MRGLVQKQHLEWEEQYLSRVFISFVGSHDFAESNNGPIEQLINNCKPKKVVLFITKGQDNYIQKFIEQERESYYKSITNAEFEVIYTDIDDPTNFQEIAEKISSKIDEVNEEVVKNKYQTFVNLTSGSPAILSVLSLFIITGKLNRAFGMYAKNPKYGNKIIMNNLDFYQNSFAYKTVKKMINQRNFVAIEDFLSTTKDFRQLSENKNFKAIVSIAKNHMSCNYSEMKKLLDENQNLNLNISCPITLYEKALECYKSIKELYERQNDTYQATLKASIVRENLLFYLVENILKSKKISSIIKKKSLEQTDSSWFFDEDNLYSSAPDLAKYLEETLIEQGTKFEPNREITSFLAFYIFKYFSENDKTLTKIRAKFNGIDDLRAMRNTIAHTINPSEFKIFWLKSLKDIINLISEYFNLGTPNFDTYKELEVSLLKELNASFC